LQRQQRRHHVIVLNEHLDSILKYVRDYRGIRSSCQPLTLTSHVSNIEGIDLGNDSLNALTAFLRTNINGLFVKHLLK
jgi:hypothetical protein